MTVEPNPKNQVPAAINHENEAATVPLSASELENLEWKRLSPLTPLLNDLRGIVAILVFLLIKEHDLLFWWWEEKNKFSSTVLFSVFGAAGAIFIGAGLWCIWSWYWSGYHLGETHFYFRKGRIFKDRRQVPLDRVQGVQQSQTLLAQIFGLYRVHIESVGGKESHVDVAFVGAKEAEYLVAEISRRSHIERGKAEFAASAGAATDIDRDNAGSQLEEYSAAAEQISDSSAVVMPKGRDTAVGNPAGAVETKLLQIKNRNLIAANLLDTRSLMLLLFYIISVGGALTWDALSGKNPLTLHYWQYSGLLFYLLFATITIFGSILSPLFKNYRTCTWSAEKGIKSTRGLTTLTRSYLPYDRIHGFTFRQPLLWRFFDWWQGSLIAAGRTDVSIEKKPDADEVIPVGDEQDLHNILDITLPDLDKSSKAEMLKEIIYSEVHFPGWIGIKAGVRWLSPLDGGVEGVKYTDKALARRWGLIDKRGVIVPLSHVQNVTVAQGPLARVLGVGTLIAYLVENKKQPCVKMSLLPLAQAIEVAQELNQLVLANMKPLQETLKERV